MSVVNVGTNYWPVDKKLRVSSPYGLNQSIKFSILLYINSEHNRIRITITS